ncbi:MAG: head GIN domain-containing protein [Fluviicola sp.]
MTSDDLNQLFASARDIPVETAPEQVAGWVGTAAATSTGVLGMAAKLKLIIAKKTFIIMGIILSVTSLGVILTMSLSSNQTTKEKTPEYDNLTAAHVEDPVRKEASKQTQIIFEDTVSTAPQSVKLPAPPNPTLSLPAAAPIPPMPVMAPFDQQVQVHGRGFGDFTPQLDVPGVNYTPKGEKDNNPEIKGNGKVTKMDRSVGPFKEIHVSGIVDVVITQGDQEKVVVETDSNLQEYVSTEVDGNKLVIKNAKGNFKKLSKMVAHVTVKDLSKIKSTGVGDMTCEGVIESNSLALDINNVGDLSLKLDCVALEVDLNGVGNLTLEGTAQKATVTSSGVGNLKAYDLEVATMNMKHSGVGNASIYVSEDLTLKYTGVGNVNYKGNPKKKDIKNSGVGSVKNKS